MLQQPQLIPAKNPHKSEITHFVKKNSGLPPSQMSKGFLSGQLLHQTESTQSFKASPVKSDVGLVKNYPQSIKKTSSNKTHNMHKKTVSLIGTNHTSQHSNLAQDINQFDFSKASNQMTMINSQKQSYTASQQNSFNDYSSNNINYGLPKVDNLMGGNDKTGSLLTAQQQLQLKQYQKGLHETQAAQANDSLGGTQIAGGFGLGSSIDMQQISSITQIGGFKSFDQRPPTNQVFNQNHQNQSQRHSIMSTTGIMDQGNNHMQNPAYRSHTNSFKSNNNITMKYPPTKYVKGGPGQAPQSAVKNKKTLQYHHQRTFSDNPNFTSSRGQLFNASGALQTGQNTNRNFQELIRAVHEKEQYQNEQNGLYNMVGISNTEIQQNYPLQSATSSINIKSNQTYNNAKTTIGSSRQSAQSQALIDDRQAILALMKSNNNHNNNQDKYQDIKQIYQGTMKEQIQQTKNALKLTQNQFGGPSRKVVQHKLNPNTQSYRASNQNTLTQSTKISLIQDPKATPKLYLTKSKKGSKNTSQNTSAHGVRSNNTTQLQSMQILLSEKVSKRKEANNKFEASSSSVIVNNINLSGVDSGMIVAKGKKEAGAAHKRSVSDGNTIFQSLSNRAQLQVDLNQNAVAQQIYKGNNKPNNMIISQQQEMPKSSYSNQQSTVKISQSSYNNQQLPKFNNEYQLQSERVQFNISKQQQMPPNVIINSHRQVGVLDARHQRHNSHQITLNQDQQLVITQQQQQPIQNKAQVNKMKQRMEVEMVIEDQEPLMKPNQETIRSVKNQNQAYPWMDKGPSTNNSYMGTLKPVEERIETQESAMSDPNLSPRTRKNIKLSKMIKLAFQRTSNPPATTSDFYKIGKVMGKGAFGKVNLAIHRLSGKFVALKSINKQYLNEEASKRKVMQEFNILRRTRHRNIVRLYESFETTQHIVFVMEVCGAGDLLTYVRRRRKLKEDVAKHMFKQIVDGLRYCHSRGILHRDIKLDNILLTSEGDIRICDFGVSKLVKHGEIMTEQCGTPAYIAPEIFENKGYEGYASDVWSAGVVLYAMLYGTVPFKASNMSELQKQIIKVQTTFKDEISPESINLLKAILERDPAKRLSIPEILRHPWMKDIPDSVNVFTDQEKEKVDSEFEYYNFKNDNNPGEVIHTDPFTEQMLNSTQNSLVKNVSTKSVILAPFNSTRSHIDENYHNHKSIQDLMVEKKFVKFAAKVKEIDRQYEANNNGDLDNGVYHQDTEEEKKEEEEKKKNANKKSKYNSIETSFDKDKGKNGGEMEEDDGELQKEIEDAQKLKKQSEWQKLEQIVIDKQKNDDEEDDKNHKSNCAPMGSAMTIVIDDKIIGEIERFNFPKTYIINSINNDDLNYATSFYHLLTTQKEY